MHKINSLLLSSVLMVSLFGAGCAEHRHVYVETYGPAETPYYTQWERDTHRQHVEYERRKKAEQHEYWEWRKHHRDQDHDHNLAGHICLADESTPAEG